MALVQNWHSSEPTNHHSCKLLHTVNPDTYTPQCPVFLTHNTMPLVCGKSLKTAEILPKQKSRLASLRG